LREAEKCVLVMFGYITKTLKTLNIYIFMVNPNISEKLALNVIKLFQPLTIWELSKKMEISYSSTFRLIKEMKRKDFITIEKRPVKIKSNMIRIKEQNGR